MGVRDKVAAEEFTILTDKTPEQIRVAGQHAIEAGRRFMTSTIKEKNVTDSMIQYVIYGPGGIMQHMLVNLAWTETGDQRKVTLEAPSFLTTRSTFLFIPLTPKRAPALGSLKRFASALKTELET